MKRGLTYGLVAAGLFALWWTMRHHDRHVDQAIAAPVLGPSDRIKYVVDSRAHTVTAVTHDGVTRTFLNPHGPVSITEKKDGSVSLAQRTFGTIHEPNAGAAFGTDFKFRVAVGVNLLYVQRFELGAGLLVSPSQIKDVRGYVAAGYNVYSNWLISAGVDNHKAVHLIASVRL